MSGPSFTTLTYGVEEGIATVCLNRPERLNAATPDMARELIAALDASDGDDRVRVVIVTGAGRAFCAGADLADGKSLGADGRGNPGDVEPDWGGQVALRLLASLKPVIAAINGPAVGIGATLPLAMDIRLASTAATFAFPFVRLGIVPESAASWFLPRVVGIGTALEWCLTGRLIDPEEAQRRGLVRSVHEPAELLPAAMALAREMADHGAPVSQALTRQLLWGMLAEGSPEAAHRAESLALHSRKRSADMAEGVAAFRAKRLPRFVDGVSAGLPAIPGVTAPFSHPEEKP